MITPSQAIRTMKLVRIIAAVLIIASAVLYFYARELALYPALAGFVLIAFINLPLNIWLTYKSGKQGRKDREKFNS